ncbi:MAG: PASTA domain-containing protein, partial [Mycobacteriaceae bacterium]
TAAVIGTAQYLSPEQARGRSAEARSDIYAAGCVYYEVTTGRPPFSGESPFSVAFQHVQDAPTPPSQVPGMDLDPDPALALDAVTLTAMAKDPSDRYDSSADMAADLERIANGRMPLAAQAYADIPEDAPTSHMAAAPVAAGAAGAAAGAGAAGAAAAQGPPPEQEPDPEERKEKKPRRGWVTALAVIAVLALIGAGSFAAWNWINDDDSSGEQQVAEQVNIPDVSDMSRSEAETELRNAGFEVTVEERADAEIERDQVIATEPAADSSVPEGSSVTLLVSSGKEITEVPDLSGLTTEQAQAALSDANLRLRSNVSEQASDEVEVGQIMEQTHASGSQVTVGTEVGITVSTGPEDVRVPTVVGQSMDDATENLESAGFEVEVNMVDSTEPENRVLSATNEGSRQPPGSTVTLEVSRGNQFEMPQLVGKDYEEVFSDLQNAGWRGSPDRLERDNVNQLDPRAVDRVVGQSAREGETIDRNAPITVRVNVLGIP